jgi:hypothetical protein
MTNPDLRAFEGGYLLTGTVRVMSKEMLSFKTQK